VRPNQQLLLKSSAGFKEQHGQCRTSARGKPIFYLSVIQQFATVSHVFGVDAQDQLTHLLVRAVVFIDKLRGQVDQIAQVLLPVEVLGSFCFYNPAIGFSRNNVDVNDRLFGLANQVHACMAGVDNATYQYQDKVTLIHMDFYKKQGENKLNAYHTVTRYFSPVRVGLS